MGDKTLVRVSKEEQKIQVGISFSPEVLKKIDEIRGHEDRSHFAERMILTGILIQEIVSGKIKISGDKLG